MTIDAEPPHAEAEVDRVDRPAWVTTMLPPQLLQGGETIILQLKPSPFFILLDSLGSLAALAALFVCVTAASRHGHLSVKHTDLLLTALGLAALLRLFWQFLEWLSRVYVLTDRRIVRVKGVLRVSVFETSLRSIQHTSLQLSLRERLFGLGTIGFATAGTAVTEALWTMIARPLDVNQIVIETLERYR